MKITLNILLLFVLFQSSAQNLVPNPSFEDTIFCPSGAGSDLAVVNWINPTLASPDHFHACSDAINNGVPINWLGEGYQNAKTGIAYAGFVTFANSQNNYREYWEIELTTPLDSGTTYYWSFWVSRFDNIDYASNNIFIHFSQGLITASNEDVINVTPHGGSTNVINDSVNWVEIKGQYNAIGGEDHLIIGNFLDDLSTSVIQNQTNSLIGDFAYYYIDDVCVSTDSTSCFAAVNMIELNYPSKTLIKIVDFIGRETEDKPNTLLIYVYSDGTTEKIYRVE